MAESQWSVSAMEFNHKIISELLKVAKDATTIVITGQPGSGKTWVARKFSARATEDDLFDFVLWFSLNRKYDQKTLYESIFHQLYPLSTTEKESEADNDMDTEYVIDEKKWEHLKKDVEAVVGSSFLLIFDDETDKKEVEDIINMLPGSWEIGRQLVISVKKDNSHVPSDGTKVLNVIPLSKEDSLSLLRERAGTKAFEFLEMVPLAKAFVETSLNLPAEIISIAKALRYFCECDSGVQILESAFQEASDGTIQKFIRLLCRAYPMLPSSILMDCAWSGSHFFFTRKIVQYNELIAYWIMEGHLGRIDSIEKAYEEGYRILEALIDFRLLKKAEDDHIIMERSVEADHILLEREILNCHSCQRTGFRGAASLGLATVFCDGEWEGLGRLIKAGCMIRTPRSSEKTKLSTLLLDGNLLSGEVWKTFFSSSDPNHVVPLQVLAIFNPACESLPPVLPDMKQLNTLVLRGCDFLGSIEDIKVLSKLIVLEISGASSLRNIPDDFFEKITLLRSLNLSGLQIEYLPSSFKNLTKLQCLLLKDCPNLIQVKDLKYLQELVVLNLSGSTSVSSLPFPNLEKVKNLQILDMSRTKVRQLPKFGKNKLTHILLRGCQFLQWIPSIEFLSSLQVLDISGSKNFFETHNSTFERNTCLKIIDFSESRICQLPTNIGNPRHLYLKNCCKIEGLPYIGNKEKDEYNWELTDLETLDLSGATELAEIEGRFFQHLTSLQTLDLSRTKIRSLPSFPNPCNIRQLLLSGCSSLVELPQPNNLNKLEVLDLSGCSALTVIEENYFDKMTRLKRLSLSEIEIESLPSLSKLSSLRALSLNKCPNLRGLPLLTSLKKLEELNLCKVTCLQETDADFLGHMCHLRILDLSETLLNQLPLMSNLKNLEQLFLRGCPDLKEVPGLEELDKLEVLDLSGTTLSHLPSLKKCTNLRQLLIGDCPKLEEFVWVERHGIEQHPSDPSLMGRSVTHFHFSVCLVDQRKETAFVCFTRDELIFRDSWYRNWCSSHIKRQSRCLEICGFHKLPEDIGGLLSRAENLFLIDNTFIKRLDALGVSNIKLLKGCWIERCKNMESVFHAEVEDVAELGASLDILWLSNLLNLKSIYSRNLQSCNLKCLYLDCCPELKSVFSLSQLPENLEVLHIKYCDKLEALFDEKSENCILPKLHTLHMWALPKFERLGCEMPCLRTLKFGNCSVFVYACPSSLAQSKLEIVQIK